MKHFLASGVLMSALLSFLVMLSPASLAFAATPGERSQAVASITRNSDVAHTASICVQRANERRCSDGEQRKAGTSIFVTASTRPAPVAPWHLVMMAKETAPAQGIVVQVNCGQRTWCQVSGPAAGPGTVYYWSCITDQSNNLPDVCSKAGPHAILSNAAQVRVS